MSTYLIFFGKSQDFVFHAFDEYQYIENFNEIIKDFDELESKIFTVDDVSNKQMLSKYVFEKNGKIFSLLKLYSLAQAFDGSRIGGSIYGVGLLSEKDIQISDVNLSILNSAKKSFSQLSLDGVKFKSSNFFSEVEKIWRALLNQNGINYFHKIEYRNFPKNLINNKVKAFFVSDLLQTPTQFNQEIENASRLYFSNDFAHLKRTQSRWGKDAFPIYQSENGEYVLYKEPPTLLEKTNALPTSSNLTDLKLENGELKRTLETIEFEFTKKLNTIIRKSQKIIIGLSAFSLLSFTLFIWKFFFEKDEVAGNNIIKKELVEPKAENKISELLGDSLKIGKLDTLITNISVFREKRLQKNFDAIKRDAKFLDLELDLLNLGDTTNLKKAESLKGTDKKEK